MFLVLKIGRKIWICSCLILWNILLHKLQTWMVIFSGES